MSSFPNQYYYFESNNVLYNDDCIKTMQKEIQDESIDMILCDLPYGMTKNSWDSIIPLDDL